MKLRLIKLKFFKPEYKKILALDDATFYRNKFFPDKDLYNILCTRYEEFYFTLLVKSIFLFFSKKYNLTILQIYILESIKWLNPKFIISFTDYDYFFFTLKKYFPDKKIIIFQGSYRSHGTLDNQIKSLSKLNRLNKRKLTIDYFFIYGKILKIYYQKLINTKFISIGSVRNNFIVKKFKKNKKSLVIISHFTKSLDIYTTKYYKLIKTLKLIEKYCKINNLELVVFGRAAPKFQNEEINFYRETFDEGLFKYYPSQNKSSPRKTSNHYENSEKYSFFVNFTSTLGYELATKEKRVAFVYGSLIRESNKQLRFGYPQKIGRNGKFWTDSLNEKEIFRILNFVINVDKKIWRKLIKKSVRPVIDFDYGNLMIKKLFRI